MHAQLKNSGRRHSGRVDVKVAPYRKQRASLKAPLCRANPCSEMGKAESQLEAPFSEHIERSWWVGFASNPLLFLLRVVYG